MAGRKLGDIFRPTKRDSKRDKEKNEIVVHPPVRTVHESGVKIGPSGEMTVEGTIPEEFQNQIKAIFSERKGGKFLPGSPVETQKKSERGPTIAKGLTTAEILAMMRELCLPGNPWDIYTYVRVCFDPSPAWVSQCLLHSSYWFLHGNIQKFKRAWNFSQSIGKYRLKSTPGKLT